MRQRVMRVSKGVRWRWHGNDWRGPQRPMRWWKRWLRLIPAWLR